jgi:hypothetical protein
MTVQVFVDSIDEGVATLLPADGSLPALTMPSSALPPGTREGDWIELSSRAIPPPEGAGDLAARRRRLSRDDDGGDLKL